jgi:queuosine precursor transporter
MLTLTNEIVFFIQTLCVALGSVVMLRLGCAALTAYVGFLGILSNLLVCKEIVLFRFTVTASDSIAVGLILSLNLIQEWYGRDAARRAIYTNFLLLLMYIVLTQIHILYAPGQFDEQHLHYASLFSFMPRLGLASLASYLVVQIMDNLLYQKLATMWHGRWFTLRNIVSLCSSELIDTLLFSFLGLYGSVSSIADIIIFSYAIKLVSIVCFIPLIALIKKIVPYDKQSI